MQNYNTQNYICSLKAYIKSGLMAFERIELFQVPQCFYQLKNAFYHWHFSYYHLQTENGLVFQIIGAVPESP